MNEVSDLIRSTNDNLTNYTIALTTSTTPWEDINLSYAIPVGCILGTMILVTAMGNLMVVTAVVRERQLHTVANKLVASLAITDLMVAVLDLPLAAAVVLVGHWPFGSIVCDLFITLDVLLCTNSILHLVAIAIDRYWTITDVSYTRGNKKQKYFFPIIVSTCWFLAAAVCLPPFFGWRTQREKDDNSCLISQDKGYTIYSTLTAFYLPLIIIIIIYTRIFLIVRTRVRRKNFRNENGKTNSAPCKAVEADQHKRLLEDSKSALIQSPVETMTYHDEQKLSDPDSNGGTDNSSNQDSIKTEHSLAHDTVVEHNPQSKTGIKTILKKINKKCNNTDNSKNKKKLAQKRERKALRTLLVITGIFIMCWLPYFILEVIKPFYGEWVEMHIPQIVSDIFAWLGYSNSMLNPFIYTIFSPDFRAAFRKLLSGRS